MQPTLEDIIARADEEEGAPSYGCDADFCGDPLCAVDLAAVLAAALHHFAHQSGPRFYQAAAYLTPPQLAMLQRVQAWPPGYH